jgi:RNA polymerase sigma-70 factor (ECF subfamily)
VSDHSKLNEISAKELEANDGLIVEAVLRGQNEVFEIFVHKYQGALLNLAAQRLNCVELAEEAVQETFLAALRSLHTYNSKFAFRTWLWTILINQCRRIGSRRQKRQMQTLSDHATESHELMHSRDEDPSLAASRREASYQLKQFLTELPAAQAEALRLRFFDGLKYREIAETMQSSLSSAKQRVRFGLEAISSKLVLGTTPLRAVEQTPHSLNKPSHRDNE